MSSIEFVLVVKILSQAETKSCHASEFTFNTQLLGNVQLYVACMSCVMMRILGGALDIKHVSWDAENRRVYV